MTDDKQTTPLFGPAWFAALMRKAEAAERALYEKAMRQPATFDAKRRKLQKHAKAARCAAAMAARAERILANG